VRSPTLTCRCAILAGWMEALTALQAAEALARALGAAYGSITVDVWDGEVRVVKHEMTLKPDDLAQLLPSSVRPLG